MSFPHDDVGLNPPDQHRQVAMYRFLRPLLFRVDAETTHELIAGSFGKLGARFPLNHAMRAATSVRAPELVQTLWGRRFDSPVGLAAGFDKNGTLFEAFSSMGFGFIELGTVTALAQPGNPKPRLFRLPADRALVNRMGFNNQGADALVRRLRHAPARFLPGGTFPLGINIGRSKVVSNEAALDDYLASLEALHTFASYIVVNISSPNTPELRQLQEAAFLRPLLAGLSGFLQTAAHRPPLLLKIAPDLSDEAFASVCEVIADLGIDGLICANTTIGRNDLRSSADTVQSCGAGGLSGAPLQDRMLALVRAARRHLGPDLPIVAAGGIDGPEAAWAAITAGANLIQLYTALIYEGPGLIRRINLGLQARARALGLQSISEVVGTA